MYRIAAFAASSFFLFTIWVIYLANTGGSSVFFNISNSTPYGDKIGHLILFGSFTFLLNFALKFRRFTLFSKSILTGTVCIVLFALGEEISQAFIATREFDLIDLASDAVGIGFFNFLSERLSKRRFVQVGTFKRR